MLQADLVALASFMSHPKSRFTQMRSEESMVLANDRRDPTPSPTGRDGTSPSSQAVHDSVCSNRSVTMHELSICEAIVSTAAKHAEGRSVSKVTVKVGHLRQVVPDALQFSWEVVRGTTVLKDAALIIEHTPAVVVCRECGARTTLDLPILACSQCGGFDVELLSGEELLLVSIDLVDA